MDDQAELQRELSWKDPAPERDDRRLAIRPRGTNVIFGIGGILWVSGLGLYLRWFGPVNTKNGVSPVIACMVTMGCWLGVSHLLSRRIWVAAGPSVRAGLRPFGLLGPIPAAIILVAIMGAAIGVAQRASQAHSLEELLRGGPLEGTDWRVAFVGGGANARPILLGFNQAQARCAALGPQWHLPGRGDLAFLNRELKAFAFHSSMFHAVAEAKALSEYGPGKALFFSYDGHGRVFEPAIAPAMEAAVVCIRARP